MKIKHVIASITAAFAIVSFVAIAGCAKKEVAPKDPVSIEILTADVVSTGFTTLEAKILPEEAEQSFTSTLIGEHTYVALEDNELAISQDIEDGYSFTVEVASAVNPEIKTSKQFTVDNTPPDGLHITTVQRVIDAQYDNGKLQLQYTIMPEAEVTFSLQEDVSGVTISESGEIAITDPLINNGTQFVVVANSGELSTSINMTVINNVARPISTKEDFLAIWTGNNEESRARMSNHYVLQNNIDLGENAKVFGVGDMEDYVGFSGTLDGNGYTISWINKLSVGWNSGFIARVENSGVIKNLGLQGTIEGAIAAPIGLVYGTVENCFFDVDVIATKETQTYGTGIAALCGNAVIRNCISIGSVSGLTTGSSSIYGKVHDGGSVFSIVNCYALYGTVTDAANVLSKDQMMTASSFAEYDVATAEGFDRTLWRILDGSLPALKNGFIEPANLNVDRVTAEGNVTAEETLGVSHGEYQYVVSILDAENKTAGVLQKYEISYMAEGAEGTFTVEGTSIRVNGENAQDGDKLTLIITSSYNSALSKQIVLTYSNRLAVLVKDNISEDELRLEYSETDSSANQLSTNNYYTAIGASSEEVVWTYALAETYEGVTIDSNTGVVTIDDNSNNNQKIGVIATATVGDNSADSELVYITVTNARIRDIADEIELRNALSGETAASHLYNNYRLTANVELTSAWVPYIDQNNGFAGTFDGNGYTISNLTITSNGGWNTGFFGHIAANGVVKNLALIGSENGVYAKWGGAMAGYLYGTIENCFVNVNVYSDNANAPCGTIVGSAYNGSKIKNCIVIGNGEQKATDAKRGVGLVATCTSDEIVENTLALLGTVDGLSGEKTAPVAERTYGTSEAELKTASTFEGWDTSVWYIANGMYPMLKYAGFEAPTAIAINNETTVGSNIDLEIDATVTGSGSWKIISVDTSDSNIVWEDGSKVVKVGYYTPNGATFTVKVAAEYAPEIIAEKMFTVSVSSMATFEGTPETITYSGSDEVVSAGTYLKHNMGDSATVAYSLGGTYEGVTINSETGVITVGAASNNKEEITVNVTVSNGTETKEASFKATIVNEVFKTISTVEEFSTIWYGENAKLHMYNNYRLTADIALEGAGKVIGVGDFGDTAWGIAGTLDGNGYTISWTNTVYVGWNSGFIARVEEGGIVRNVKLQGTITGAIAGPIGIVYGTVENCFFEVNVVATKNTQTYGTGIGALCGNGIFKNSIAVGTVTGLTTGTSGVYGKTHDGGKEENVINCYALSGTVTSEANILTDEQMKTVSTFEGWDTTIWTIIDGSYPVLINGCSMVV
ncbi:MAG: hypothetical protein ACI4MQ_07980 [Candidatus Coproplasma sp.]